MVHGRVAFPVIAGIAGLLAMLALAFALTTQPKQGSDLSVLIPQKPINGTIVGTAPNTTGGISREDAIIIALNETGLIDEREKIKETYADWFYVDENGHAYKVNPETMEMVDADDKSRIVENG